MIQNGRVLPADFSSDDNFEVSETLEAWRLSDEVSDLTESGFAVSSAPVLGGVLIVSAGTLDSKGNEEQFSPRTAR